MKNASRTKIGKPLQPVIANKKVYVCPMTECKTVQDHKGECPVCGMDLVGYKTENQNDR